ncbi:MAG: hypothetical protein RMH93_04470 [Aquificaceae bacterium]|nr:hypothetical protein [Aquificaceae bacterium]
MRDIVLRVAGLILIILLPVGGFLLWEHYKNKKLQEFAYREYEINKLIRAGNYSKAKELIDSSSKDNPFKPLLLSYELYIGTYSGEKVEEGKVIEEIIKTLKDKELLALYRERRAYYLFKEGKLQEAMKEVENIKEGDFNYPSALLLKAQILRREGKVKEAEEVLKKAKERGSESYFANMAQALSLVGD